MLFRSIEAQERAQYWKYRQATPGNPEIAAECEKRLEEFIGLRPSSASTYYPSDCPAKPIDAWQFASFGQFFAGLSIDARTNLRQQVVSIRNAVAHGHYVSWRLLATLQRCRQELQESPRKVVFHSH